jgi:ribonuclease HI
MAVQAGELLEDSGYQPEQALKAATKIVEEGQACRKCGSPVEKRTPKGKRKPNQEYWYEWYLACPDCNTMYMVEEAKRFG